VQAIVVDVVVFVVERRQLLGAAHEGDRQPRRGLTSPKITSAIARPPSIPVPREQDGTDAPIQRSTTIALPPSRTTTVRGLAAATPQISSSCAAGSSSPTRSPAAICPSPSSFVVRPTTTIAASAPAIRASCSLLGVSLRI
jgi:hypothetical protein